MDRIRHLALLSISRGCAFAGIAIVTLMVGLSYDPVMMTQAGAISLTIAAVVLRLFAMAAPRRNPRRTEIWIMLDPGDVPPADVAQRVIGKALAEIYLLFSRWTLVSGLTLWGLSILLRLIVAA